MPNSTFKTPSASVIVKVPFHDVDSAYIAWHGHYAKYFEIARCELLDSFDYNYQQMSDSGFFWPVIDMQIRYVKPAVFQQELKVTATLAEWENRLLIRYLIEDAHTGQRLTKGQTAQVAVRMDTKEMLLASPTVLLEKLGINDD